MSEPWELKPDDFLVRLPQGECSDREFRAHFSQTDGRAGEIGVFVPAECFERLKEAMEPLEVGGLIEEWPVIWLQGTVKDIVERIIEGECNWMSGLIEDDKARQRVTEWADHLEFMARNLRAAIKPKS